AWNGPGLDIFSVTAESSIKDTLPGQTACFVGFETQMGFEHNFPGSDTVIHGVHVEFDPPLDPADL
ncbi:hypothetical protein KIPB_013824, partial [Kipferlia bialata]